MDKNLLVKSGDFSCEEFGVVPIERDVDELLDKGFIVVDKDAGPTSHSCADFVKKIFHSSKTGHSGTLDPAVTGVLVMGLGKGTRLMEYMLKSDKVYVCLMYVHKPVSKERILEAFSKFTGKIKQTPPIISAVKRQEREREIYSIDLLDYKDEGKNILFSVSCQHGTYIRKLCSDMGDFLGTGAQMMELRRTKAGPFTEDDFSIGVDRLRNLFGLYLREKDGVGVGGEMGRFEQELRKFVRPMEDLLVEFPKVIVHDSCIDALCHGYGLAVPGVARLSKNIHVGDVVGIYSVKGELVAISEALMSSDEVMDLEHGIAFKMKKVFMDVGYYPDISFFKESCPEQFVKKD